MRKLLITVIAALMACGGAHAADLTLLAGGKSDYQIVVPDKLESQGLTDSIAQTARLLQVGFKANGADVPVVAESARDSTRPALLLGDTKFARQNGFDPAALRGWSYIHRAVDKNIIVAGHDHPARTAPTEGSRWPNWDRVGTAKAAADFARQYMGVRFLYPDVAPYNAVGAAAKIDLLASPAIEFLPMKSIVVPSDLNVTKTPVIRANTSHPAGASFYDLAHNRFPRVDELLGGHTWERAVPRSHFEKHPEYFALINGQRLKPEGATAQYCLSNPDVQEMIYRDIAGWFDRGYLSADLGQPDGFRECQCEACERLYDTGKDWGEKIWIFNRGIAERLEKSHPGRGVMMMSYILTANPPKSFKKFPSNTGILLTGTNEEDIAPWRGVEVPRGFSASIYNWCPNLGTRYTPMRTPGFVETQVKRLAANKVQAIYRDGPGQLFGMEGPVYYVMGRMFDDPEHNTARDLMAEYCEAAFVSKSTAFYMRGFYDDLYHAIELYSDHIGTRCDAWTYQTIEGRPRKTVQDPFQFIAFLYPPTVLEALDANLSQAERTATTPKVKTRLSLVRTEFEYLRHLAKVVHLHQAWLVQPDAGSRDRLLDAIDARNAFIDSLYDKRGAGVLSGNWSHVLFPFMGHDSKHLRLAHNGYQEPYANTCFNWDTKAMRAAPTPGKKRLTVAKAAGPVPIDSPAWDKVAVEDLTIIPPLHTLPRKTTLRLMYDAQNLYIRTDSELEPDGPTDFPTRKRDALLTNLESLELTLAPQPGKELFYRFATGANADAKYDAVNGLIADAMDPRHGKDDPTWNGQWQSESRVDARSHRWQSLITIPFKTLGVEAPTPGISWRANFARYHLLPRERIDRTVWSSMPGNASMDDRGVMGAITFD